MPFYRKLRFEIQRPHHLKINSESYKKLQCLSPPACFMVVVWEESLGTVCYCRAAQYHSPGSHPATRQKEVGERRDKSLSDAHTLTHTDTSFTTSFLVYEIIKHVPHSGSADALNNCLGFQNMYFSSLIKNWILCTKYIQYVTVNRAVFLNMT